MKTRISRRTFVAGAVTAVGAACGSSVSMRSADAAPLTATPGEIRVILTVNGRLYSYSDSKVSASWIFDQSRTYGFVEKIVELTPPAGAPAALYIRVARDQAPGSHLDVRFGIGKVDPVNDNAGKALAAQASAFTQLVNASVEILVNGQAIAGYFGPTPVSAGPIRIPTHCWWQQWRWQNAPRPIVFTPQQLIAKKLIPPYGASDVPASSAIVSPETNPNVAWYTYTAPLRNAGVTQGMGNTAERYDLGVCNEIDANLFMNPTNASALKMAQSWWETSGSVPQAYIDKNTNAPINLVHYPKANNYGTPVRNLQGQPQFQTAPAPTNGWQLSTEHQPSLAATGYLMTGDSYHLLNAQFEGNIVPIQTAYYSGTWGAIPDPSSNRSFAWGMNLFFKARLCTQVAEAASATRAIPSCFLPSSVYRQWSATLVAWFNGYVNSTTAPCKNFSAGPTLNFVSPWQDHYISSVLQSAIWYGFSEWKRAADWKIKVQKAMTNGTSGFPPAFAGCFWLRYGSAPVTAPVIVLGSYPDSDYFPNWYELFQGNVPGFLAPGSQLNQAQVNALNKDQTNGGVPIIPDNDVGPDYLVECRGALALATANGDAEAAQCLANINVYTRNRRFMVTRWAVSPVAAGVNTPPPPAKLGAGPPPKHS